MSELSDIQIRAWIKKDERFEQRGDEGGLILSFGRNFPYRSGDFGTGYPESERF